MKYLEVWSALRPLAIVIASWLLGFRVTVAYANSVVGVSNPEMWKFDLPLIAVVAIVIYASLHPKPSRWQAVRLILLGSLMVGVSAFITLMVYSFAAGVLGEY
jgi:hypothetical protein